MNKITSSQKTFTFYSGKEKTQPTVVSYEELVETTKKIFINVVKSCNIDNELRAEHKPDDFSKKTLFEKYLDIHKGVNERSIDTTAFEMLESMYIETLRTLDIDNKLSDLEKYAPKKYNDPRMSAYEKIELKGLIEPNLWNRLDDYIRVTIDKYPYENPNHEYMSTFAHHQLSCIYIFITDFMFYWGDGIGLYSELNPITPVLTEKFNKLK